DYPAAPAWWFLERNLPRFAGRVAVRELDFQTLAERRVLTYEALFRAARGVATGLRARGVGPGLRVALCVANGAGLIVGYHATWIVGGVVVPLNPIAHEVELEHHLADAAVSLVVAARGSRGEGAAGRLKLPCLDPESFRAMAELEPAAPAP